MMMIYHKVKTQSTKASQPLVLVYALALVLPTTHVAIRSELGVQCRDKDRNGLRG